MKNLEIRKFEKSKNNFILALAMSLLFALSLEAATVTWTGGDADNPADWFADANWDGAAVPIEGDDVVVPSGAKITISNSTPALASISVTGTLTFTNWMTRLNATSVTVNNGGILTCTGPYTTSDMSNRVWIACTDFNLLSGGKIDVTEKGYGLYVRKTGTWNYGPGSEGFTSGGAAHGGYGARHYTGSGRIYGDIKEPQCPGSTGQGKGSWGYAMRYAGGAVFIDAAGTVVLNGSITACAGDGSDCSGRGGASGGSILIHSKKIKANGGALRADGGSGYENSALSEISYPGAGGRIAVHYDAAEQSAEDLVSLTVSALPAKMYSNKVKLPYNYTPDKDNADIGTVYFTDAKPLKFLGTLISGQLYFGSDITSYTADSIVMTAGWVRFAQEGFKLIVTGDVTLSGSDTRLEMGGHRFGGYATLYPHRLFSGSKPWSLDVGGNMTVSDGALVRGFAASTNGSDIAFGGDINVAGNLELDGASNSALSGLCLSCCPTNGGAVKVTAKNITVGSQARVFSDIRGFQYSTGPGRGYSNSQTALNSNKMRGAGHGGDGNNINSSEGKAYGFAYGDALLPLLPGSGGHNKYDSRHDTILSGAGVVYLTAENAMKIDGKISADCMPWTPGESYCRFACGSGGSVLLMCKKFSMGESAVISAKGGGIASINANFYNAGLGGGGRIAVYTGAAYVEGETKRRRLEASSEKPEAYLGSFSVAGGEFKDANGYSRKYVKAGDMLGNVVTNGVLTDLTGVAAESAGWYACPLAEATIRGGEGTIRFVNVESGRGLSLIVR